MGGALISLLLIQATQNTAHPYYKMSQLQAAFIGIPLVLILLTISIGFVFKWEEGFDYMIKLVPVLLVVSVIGLIVSLFI